MIATRLVFELQLTMHLCPSFTIVSIYYYLHPWSVAGSDGMSPSGIPMGLRPKCQCFVMPFTKTLCLL